MATFSTDVAVEPEYIDFINIGAGYGVMSIPVDGLLPGDQVQECTVAMTDAGDSSPSIEKSIDLVQRTQGFFEYTTQLSISAHFTITPAEIQEIAAGEYTYSMLLSVLRNGTVITREVQAGQIAGRYSTVVPAILVSFVELTGGPADGDVGDSQQLVGTAFDGQGVPVPGIALVWASSNVNVATVDQSGLVQFISPGVAIIYVSYQGVQDQTDCTTHTAGIQNPTNKQVIGWLDADNSYEPHSLDASWIAPGTFQAGNYAVVGNWTASAFIGDGSQLTNVAASSIAGTLPVAHGGTGRTAVTAGNLVVGAGTGAMTELAPGAVAGFVRSDGTTWARAALLTADISDLASAATGITKLGTVNTGVWQGSSIATTYTDAKVKTATGTTNRLTVAGTSTDPTFDISSAYVGQATITTLGTIATGVWQGTSVGTAYTDAKVVSISGVSDRTSVTGTATVPIVDIAGTYVGQASITTLGTITSGTWHGSAIATTYTQAQIVTVTGTAARLTIGGTSTDPTFDIASTYVGQTSITTLGIIATGTWQGTSIATTYTDAKVKTVTGTALRLTIGGSATDPTFDISTSYAGQATIVTLGTVATGVWNASVIGTTYTQAQLITLAGTSNRVTIGGTLTDPTVDISAAYVGQASITTLGTIGTGVWQGTSISTTYTDAKLKTLTGTTDRITIAGTATDPTVDVSTAYVGQATITTLGTVTTGTWSATTIATTKGGTGLTAYTLGDVLYASGANTLAALAGNTTAVRQALMQTGNGAVSAAPAWTTLLTADISDIATASTGITKVGTINTGVWQGTSISTTYTDAKVKTVTGTADRLTIGGTAADPTFDIAATYAGQASIVTLGTVATGTWHGTVIGATYGGTGVNNGSSTITLAGNLVTAGAFSLTLTTTGATNVTLPTTGTLVSTAVTSLPSLTTTGVLASTHLTSPVVDSGGIAVTGNSTITGDAHVTGDMTVDGTFNIGSLVVTTMSISGTYLDTQGTITVSTPAFSSSSTWNDGSVTFVHDLVDITDSASANASMLARWRVGGSTKFGVTKAGALSLAGGATIGGMTSIALGTVVTSTPALSTTGTWDDTGTTFTHVLHNITDTNSAAASLLEDLQVGGVSKFKVSKAGAVTAAGALAIVGVLSGVTNITMSGTITGASAITATTFTGALVGNASTATALATARAINGVNFDGTAPITVTAAAGTLTGTTLAATVVTSSLTSVGTLTSLVLSGGISGVTTLAMTGALTGATTVSATTLTGTLSTAAQANVTSLGTLTALTTSGSITTTLGSVVVSTPAFTSTATWNDAAVTFVHNFMNITSTASAAASKLAQWQVGGADVFTVTKGGVVTATTFVGALTGNASTATALATARAINGTNFDGTAAITVTAAAGTLTGATLAAGVTASSLTSLGTLTALTVSGAVTVSGGAVSFSGATSFTMPAGEAWTAATLVNSWATYGGLTLQYRKDADGTVWVRGAVSGGSTSTITTLAAGYRPSRNTLTYEVYNDNGGGSVRALVNSDGTLQAANTTDIPYINISFSTV